MRQLLDAQSAIRLGSCLCGIPLTLHATFFLLLLVQLLSSLIYVNDHPHYALLMFLLYGPILLVTIVVHELGHALTTRMLGGEVGGIVLWPLGGFALCGPTDSGPLGDLKVSIAGPLTHLPQMAVWAGLYALFINDDGDFSDFTPSYYLNDLDDGGDAFGRILCCQSFYLNVTLLVFNLFVPAYPLDGGRIVASTLLLCGVAVDKAAVITSMLSMGIATALIIWGAVLFVLNGTGLFTILIGIFVFVSGKRLYDMTKDGRVRDHPIFGRECYQGGSGGGGGSGGAEGESAGSNVPATSGHVA